MSLCTREYVKAEGQLQPLSLHSDQPPKTAATTKRKTICSGEIITLSSPPRFVVNSCRTFYTNFVRKSRESRAFEDPTLSTHSDE